MLRMQSPLARLVRRCAQRRLRVPPLERGGFLDSGGFQIKNAVTGLFVMHPASKPAWAIRTAALVLSVGALAYITGAPKSPPRLEDLEAADGVTWVDPTLGEVSYVLHVCCSGYDTCTSRRQDISAELDNLLKPTMKQMREKAQAHQASVANIYTPEQVPTLAPTRPTHPRNHNRSKHAH
jgi:hypothetical protein